jgi:ABC-type amino acid transport substrate-binding protein
MRGKETLMSASMVLRAALLGSAMAAVVLAGPAAGQDLEGTLKKIKTSGTLTIGYRESSPPFSFLGPDKRPVGYTIDLCLHIAGAIQRQLGLADLKLSWVPVTVETRIPAVVQGQVDIECGSTTASLSRQEHVDFSLTTFIDGGGFLILGTSTSTLRGLGDFTGKRIGIIPGTTTEKALAEFLRKEFITVQMVKVKDHSEGLAALEGGSVEAYASDRGILVGLAITSRDHGAPQRRGLSVDGEPSARRPLPFGPGHGHLRSLARQIRKTQPGTPGHVPAQLVARIGSVMKSALINVKSRSMPGRRCLAGRRHTTIWLRPPRLAR